MKKKALLLVMGAVLALSCVGLFGCSGGQSNDSKGSGSSNDKISVYSREDGSGTRGAFVELTGVEQKNEAGEKVDKTTTSAAITNSTSVMMTSVAGDKNGIGYISLGSLNDTVKAVSINGVVPSAATIKDGSYTVQRPFNIVTKDGLSDVSSDFIKYIMSKDGQAIVEENGYIAVDDAAAAYTASNLSGKISVAGSSSVTPVMEKLAEGYMALNPNVTIEVNQSDSSTGVSMATEGTCDIGMASRDLKESESAVKATAIAKDGVAVIVNAGNSVSDLTLEQVKKIFTGEATSWSAL